MTASTTAGTLPDRERRHGEFARWHIGARAARQYLRIRLGSSTTFKDIIGATNSLSGSFASVTTTSEACSARASSPDATTPNALDATLALNPAALAASAQDLTQDARLGLDAPRVLTQAVQDRLVASGGALGEGGAIGAGQKGVAGFSFGNANIWARGADQFGSATAPSSGAGVGYDINRAAPLIAGVDWRLDNGIVAGVAATYVATSAKFKDGSSTNVSSYQGAAYAGWAGGRGTPWEAWSRASTSSAPRACSRPSGFRVTRPPRPPAKAIKAMPRQAIIGEFRPRA